MNSPLRLVLTLPGFRIPAVPSIVRPARSSFGARALVGVVLLGLFAPVSLVHAQSNFATPYPVITLAGSAGNSGSVDGVGTTARFSSPYGIAVDAAGNAYVADNGNHVIRKISPAGVVTTFAGSSGTSGSVDGSGSAARFNFPFGVAVDAAGNVYVADYFNYTIRKITAGGAVTTLAGSSGSGGATDGTGTAARFNLPTDVAVDGVGNVYVADYGNHTIRKITASGVVTTLAGSAGNSGSADGLGSAARFRSPNGLSVDGAGNVYVADYLNHTIRKITATGVVTTLAGVAGSNGTVDGIGSAAQFSYPSGVAVDRAGNVFVVDYLDQTIRKITAAGAVTSIAGLTGSVGSADGVGSAARFNFPVRIAVDADGNVFVSDNANNTIRKGIPVPSNLVISTQPLSGAVFSGGSTTLLAVVNGSPTPALQWQKNGIDVPGATNASLVLSNIQLSDAGSYALTATNSTGMITSRFARVVVLVAQQNAITYATTVSSTGVTASGIVNFDYFVTNVGTKTWGANHYLSIRDSNNAFVAFSKLIGILPGETTTANLNFPAPATPGTYTYSVQALEDGVEFFSTQTTVVLTVLAPRANSITYNTTSFPVSAAPGSAIIFTYNVTNTGTQPWGMNHTLSLSNGGGTIVSSTPLTVLASGGSKTVNLSFTTPAAPGTYNYTVRAAEVGVGDFSTLVNLTLVVLAPQPNAIVYNRVRYPDAVVPGANLKLKYTLSNAGTQAWGGGHYASLRDTAGNFLSFIPLSGTGIAAEKTVEFAFTAPTAPGIYTYYAQALEDGIEFFSTQDLVIVTVLALPRGNAVSYNSTNFPTTAASGATVNFTVEVTNRGTRSWGATHYLSFRDVDNTFLAFPALNGVSAGANQTLNLSFVAPVTPGIYTYTLQAFEDGVSFFDMADTVVLRVQ